MSLAIALPNIRKKQMYLLRMATWFPPAAQVRSWLFRADRALFDRQFRCDRSSPLLQEDQRKEFVFSHLRQRGWYGDDSIPEALLVTREAPRA
jgi:hypothetical protein